MRVIAKLQFFEFLKSHEDIVSFGDHYSYDIFLTANIIEKRSSPLIAEHNVDRKEHNGHEDAKSSGGGQQGVNCQVDLIVLEYLQSSVLWRVFS